MFRVYYKPSPSLPGLSLLVPLVNTNNLRKKINMSDSDVSQIQVKFVTKHEKFDFYYYYIILK